MATATTPTNDRYPKASDREPAQANPTITEEAIAEGVNLRRGVLWGICLSAGLWVAIFELISLLKH